MASKGIHGHRRIYPESLLRTFYLWMRGTEQILVRPAAELPLVLIVYAKGDREGMERFKESLEGTWLTLPGSFRSRYAEVLTRTPPFVVVLLRRRNLCTCLGHHHPPGTESRITRRLRGLSGIPTGELDLAFEAIRQWEPQPLSYPALSTAEQTEDFQSFRWQLALLTVFLHELHHLVSPEEPEFAVRAQSQKFYEDTLAHYVAERFGVAYGLRHAATEQR
jgi:hypothetical protein